MDRTSFVAACHDLAITLRIAGYRKAAGAFLALEAEAPQRILWNRTRALAAFLEAIGAMQDELAEALAGH